MPRETEMAWLTSLWSFHSSYDSSVHSSRTSRLIRRSQFRPFVSCPLNTLANYSWIAMSCRLFEELPLITSGLGHRLVMGNRGAVNTTSQWSPSCITCYFMAYLVYIVLVRPSIKNPFWSIKSIPRMRLQPCLRERGDGIHHHFRIRWIVTYRFPKRGKVTLYMWSVVVAVSGAFAIPGAIGAVGLMIFVPPGSGTVRV